MFNLLSCFSYICVRYLFMNCVFEFRICFVRAIIAWPGDRPIFQEEDEDMVELVDYFVEGD